MKQPRWKRWLSYLTELHIESAPSEYNPHLYVCLSKGRYQLATKSAIYSFSDLYDNYRITFDHLDWQEIPKDPEILMLGFGLGSIPDMLENHFHKSCRYTGVELDENVLYLSKKYVLDTLRSPLTVIHADAWNWVMQNEQTFDIICMDVFLDDATPEPMTTIDFLDRLKASLTPEGVLLYNCLARTKEDIAQTRTFLEDVFLPVFPAGGYLDVRGNWMLVSNKRFVEK